MDMEDDKPHEPTFDPFSVAEAACEESIDLILTEGGRLLYESYIDAKSFQFASNVIVKLLLLELKMCFVRCDRGEARRISERPTSQVFAAPCPGDAGKEHVYEDQPSEEQAGEVQMHDGFVRDGWTLEPEPTRCRIDTWARSCVPIRKKLVWPRSQGNDVGVRRNRSTPMRIPSTPRANSENRMSPSRNGNRLESTLEQQMEQKETRIASPRVQMIPLTDEREEDEEEAALRDQKDREARRKRDEEARVQKKIVEEAEEAAQLAQMKDQMNNKQFTYDGSGNVIWIQPVQLHKLPSPNPTPGYTFKKEAGMRSEDASSRPPLPNISKRGSCSGWQGGSGRQPANGEFVDSFQTFASQQPSMIETMKVAPGVELSERGRIKKGLDESTQQSYGQSTMSRKDYEEMIQKGGRKNIGTEDNSRVASQSSSVQVLQTPNLQAVDGSRGTTPRVQSKEQPSLDASLSSQAFIDASKAVKGDLRETSGNLRVVQTANTDLIRQVPPIHSPQAPPPTFRRVQMKRDALGYVLSTREKKVSTSTNSRYPSCAGQPPLGATMGHGLLPSGHKHDEYYFPNATSAGFVESLDDATQIPVHPHSARGSSRGPQGKIVNKNPELTRRLFSR